MDLSSNPFASDRTENAVVDALKQVPDLPKNEAAVGFVAKEGGDMGVEAHEEKDFGKGFYVAGDQSWMKKAGWNVAGWFGWKGK